MPHYTSAKYNETKRDYNCGNSFFTVILKYHKLKCNLYFFGGRRSNLTSSYPKHSAPPFPIKDNINKLMPNVVLFS